MTDNIINVIIVDDEPNARQVIKKYLSGKKEINILKECGNGKDALEAINKLLPDLVFLDIKMPDLDGIQVIKSLTMDVQPLIIFTTAFDQYAIPAFEMNALDYLLKPFDQDRFNNALNKAIKQFHSIDNEHFSQKIRNIINDYERLKNNNEEKYINTISIKINKRIKLLTVSNIDWIEASGDYIVLHLKDKSFIHDGSMNKIESQLNPEYFLRIHRSIIVNKHKIEEIEPYFNGEYFLFLKDNTKLKSSRSYKKVISKLISK